MLGSNLAVVVSRGLVRRLSSCSHATLGQKGDWCLNAAASMAIEKQPIVQKVRSGLSFWELEIRFEDREMHRSIMDQTLLDLMAIILERTHARRAVQTKCVRLE
jgi:hypothetical protein